MMQPTRWIAGVGIAVRFILLPDAITGLRHIQCLLPGGPRNGSFPIILIRFTEWCRSLMANTFSIIPGKVTWQQTGSGIKGHSTRIFWDISQKHMSFGNTPITREDGGHRDGEGE